MGRSADNPAEWRDLRQPGAIMLVSCYELGHQPLGIAQPIGFLEQGDGPRSASTSQWTTSTNQPFKQLGSSASRCPCTRRSGSGCGSPS